MEPAIVRILNAEMVTHNVRRFTLERPKGLEFVPGQAADISINTRELKDEKRPFTFTGLNHWKDLEFTIKIYSDHDGVTNHLGKAKIGGEIIIHSVWGAIHYYDEGVFMAGGAGVTPFIAIFRQLENEKRIGNNALICSNRTSGDIILQDEFSKLLGDRFINTLTDEDSPKYGHRKIDSVFLQDKVRDFNQYFYLCGPDKMVEDIQKTLISLGASNAHVIVEQF